MLSIRKTYLLGFIMVSALLLTSAYLQFYQGIVPCPLCSLQRLTFAMCGFLFLLGVFLHSQFWGRLLINMLALITSVIGILLASRQVWIQHFPSNNTSECGVSLQYMLQVLPLNQVVQKILFDGSVECTQRGWEFLSLNMAEWAIIWFSLLLFLTVFLFFKEFKNRIN